MLRDNLRLRNRDKKKLAQNKKAIRKKCLERKLNLCVDVNDRNVSSSFTMHSVTPFLINNSCIVLEL